MDEREEMTVEQWEETRAGVQRHLKEAEDRFFAFEGRLLASGVKVYCCPVCSSSDRNLYLRCNRPDCTDGRDPR